MLENLTELLLPALLLLAGAAGIAKKQDVYGGMLTGAQDGLRLMLSTECRSPVHVVSSFGWHSNTLFSER